MQSVENWQTVVVIALYIARSELEWYRQRRSVTAVKQDIESSTVVVRGTDATPSAAAAALARRQGDSNDPAGTKPDIVEGAPAARRYGDPEPPD